MNTPYQVGGAVAAFVFNDEGKNIVQLRTGSHGAKTWCPPGGKIDFGETPVEAIKREVKEETDLVITDVKFIGFTNDIFENDGLHYITLWYATRVSDGTPKITEPEKCLAIEWHTIADMPQPLFLPTASILNDEVAMKKVKAYVQRCRS